jgi:hypothetical protein
MSDARFAEVLLHTAAALNERAQHEILASLRCVRVLLLLAMLLETKSRP